MTSPSAQYQAFLTFFCKGELPSSSAVCLQADVLPSDNYPIVGSS